jgi:hypothetical protein
MGKKTFIPPMGPQQKPGKFKPSRMPVARPVVRRPGSRGS